MPSSIQKRNVTRQIFILAQLNDLSRTDVVFSPVKKLVIYKKNRSLYIEIKILNSEVLALTS